MAENTKSKRLFNLPETKGTFQLEGLITDCAKDDFYKEGKTQKGKDKRTLSFGVKVEPDVKVGCKIQAFEKPTVCFIKREKDGTYKTKKIPWADRFKSAEELGLGEGWAIIGSRAGLEKETNDKGQVVNKKIVLDPFDLTKYTSEHMADNQSVFIKGDIEYGSFTGEDGTKRQWSRMSPTQISLTSKEIDLDDEERKVRSDFKQTMVFTNIEQEKENDVPTGRFIVYGKIIGYSSVDDAEFYMTNKKLAKTFKKNVKPYSSIEVWGHIKTEIQTEEVEVEDDGWGEADPTKRVVNSARKELIITGASKNSIDSETYTREAIDTAIEAIKKAEAARSDFGESDDKQTSGFSTDDEWGSGFDDSSDDTEGDVWEEQF